MESLSQRVSISNRNLFIDVDLQCIIRRQGARRHLETPPPQRPTSPRSAAVKTVEFRVSRRGRRARWVVTVGDSIYGAYLDKEQALLDAIDAAQDALHAGCDAQVWIDERSMAARVL
jgi:hypothetical protein